MSETPIFDEMSAKILRHRGLNVGDFGDWVCGWCGANGDEHEDPSHISCSTIPVRDTLFLSVLHRMLGENDRKLKSRAELLDYAFAQHLLVYDKVVEMLDNANWR